MSLYLVTGGAGFIGSNLVKRLVSEGHSVRVLDNYRAGIFLERSCDGAEYLEGDIRQTDDLMRAMQGVDGVFHLAAIPRMSYSIEHPTETHEVNALGTLQVLECARLLGISRVVYSSSSSVYGGCEVGQALQEEMKLNPMSPYGLQKLIGEEYGRLYANLHRITVIALRYFNVYGSMMDPQGPYALVMGKFLRQKQAGEPMTVCGDGEYFRDYTHVSDVADANVRAMSAQNVSGFLAVNIGYGEPHSVNEIAHMIGGDVVFVEPRPGDPRWTKADNARAWEQLGWKPRVSMQEGLVDLIHESLT